MKYSLITKRGRVMMFYVLEIAEVYQSFEGGVLITQDILDETPRISEVLLETIAK